MVANVALDYTEWAPPLYIDTIRRDIGQFWARSGGHIHAPSKIILWVHQWDFLVKQYGDLKPKYVVEKAEFDGFGIKATIRPPESSDDVRIYGIKVEVRDPEAHKP